MGDRQVGEQPGHAGVENGDVFSARLVAERAGEPAFAEAACSGDEQVAAFGDPVAGGQLEEEGAVEPARDLIVDVLHAGGMTQTGHPGACFKLLLPAQRQFVFEQQAEPFGVIEGARLGFVFQFLEPLGQAVKAESVQMVERGMSAEFEYRFNRRPRQPVKSPRALSPPLARLPIIAEVDKDLHT